MGHFPFKCVVQDVNWALRGLIRGVGADLVAVITDFAVDITLEDGEFDALITRLLGIKALRMVAESLFLSRFAHWLTLSYF